MVLRVVRSKVKTNKVWLGILKKTCRVCKTQLDNSLTTALVQPGVDWTDFLSIKKPLLLVTMPHESINCVEWADSKVWKQAKLTQLSEKLSKKKLSRPHLRPGPYCKKRFRG